MIWRYDMAQPYLDLAHVVTQLRGYVVFNLVKIRCVSREKTRNHFRWQIEHPARLRVPPVFTTRFSLTKMLLHFRRWTRLGICERRQLLPVVLPTYNTTTKNQVEHNLRTTTARTNKYKPEKWIHTGLKTDVFSENHLSPHVLFWWNKYSIITLGPQVICDNLSPPEQDIR